MTAGSFSQHLEALAVAMAIDRIVPDPDGLIAIRLDAERCINLLVDGDELTLFAPLATLPEGGREAVYEHMLRANRFWRGTAGATLSLDDATPPRALLAIRINAASCPPAAFVVAVELFADRMADWSMALQEQGGEAGVDRDSTAATGFFSLA